MSLKVTDARNALRAEGVPVETVDKFIQSFLSNPEIWAEFERYALQAARLKSRIGAKAIMERVRWEAEIERGEDFKVSNNWTAYYARIFALKHPSLKDLFDFKTVKGVTV